MDEKLELLTFWGINDELKIDRMKEQLVEMKELGFDGTIFHPRNYPGIPAYMGEDYLGKLSQIILFAKEIGMSFWIYDENGWPSGNANGKVLERFPDSQCQWLELKDGNVILNSTNNFNTLNRNEMNYFVEVTYDGYRLGLHPDAFNYITGFFSDEVGFLYSHGVSMENGGIPWCEEVKERYKDQYDQDITQCLTLLFEEEEGYEVVRYRYWEILADILSESFYDTINCWCETYHKRYAAHLKGEENIFFQVPCSGSSATNLKKINTPAIDALERYPGNHYYPRVASSLAKQFYDGRCMVEAIGGSGWGLSPQDMERYVDWLAESGMNQFVFHLSQYTLNSAAVRDWPPNIPFGLNWKSAMKQLITKIHNRWDGNIIKHNPVLLVAPVRGVMSQFDPRSAMTINEHNGAGTPDTKSGKISIDFQNFVEHCYKMGMDYDVTEERLFEEHGIWENGRFRIGNVSYDHVIIGTGCYFKETELISYFLDQGICKMAQEFLWSFVKAGTNQILIDKLDYKIPYKCVSQPVNMRIKVLDLVEEVSAQNMVLREQKIGTEYWYDIPKEAIDLAQSSGHLSINIVPKGDGEQQPFAFLRGDFLVKNGQEWVEKDNRHMVAQDDFYLENEVEFVSCANLLEAGYPFCNCAVTVTANVIIGKSGCLTLSEVYGDCVFARIDGIDYGYIWGPEWSLQNIEQGYHTVELDIIPSTYNTYGPHHHIDGDRHLVSPNQFGGEKNFADFADAPDNTLVAQWHFVKFGILC